MEASVAAGIEEPVIPRGPKIRLWNSSATGLPVTCSMMRPRSTKLVFE
jgi:hypothetical protein